MFRVRGSGLCVVFLRKTVNIHSASSYPRKIKLILGGRVAMDLHPIQGPLVDLKGE